MSGFVLPVKPKQRSGSSGAPATTDIQVGELGVNVNDGTMFMNYTPGGGAQTILRFATTLDLGGLASLASPVFTGTPSLPTGTTGTTQAANDNSTKLATTAYADAAVGVEKTRALAAEALLSPLASPTFTGTMTFAAGTTAGNLTFTGSTSLIQFPSSTGARINLYSTTYGLGVSSSELTAWSSGTVAFRATSYSGTIFASFAPTLASISGALTLALGATITSGGLTITAGGLTVTAGTITYTGLTASTLPMLNSSKQLVSATLSNGLTAGSGTLTITPSGIINTPPAAKTAAYTALQTDNNSTIPVNSASSVAMTLPSLTAGTSITFAQRGAGKVTWTASGTTITVYPSGSTGSAGAGAQFTAFWDTSTTILISGAVS